MTQDMQDGVGYYSRFAHIDAWQRNLPHWDGTRLLTFVTWRLADSLPIELLKRWVTTRDQWLNAHPKPWNEATESDYYEEVDALFQHGLDRGHGACILARTEIGAEVSKSLLHFQRSRYSVTAYAVMPNHVHVLFRPEAGSTLDEIVQAWKSYTAHRINAVLAKTGRVWQAEYWDRLIRNAAHHQRVCRYICEKNHGVMVE